MRVLTLILVITLSVSCARTTLTQKIANDSEDLFKEESFLRYTKTRLRDSDSTIYKCYQGDFYKAQKELKNSVSSNKTNPKFWNTYGICYFLQQDYPKADYFFKLSLSYSKNNFLPALNNLGMSKLKQGHKLEALELFSQTIKKGPQYKLPIFNQAQVYLEYNMAENALDNLYKLYRKNPNDPEVLVSLSVGHILAQEINKSKVYLQKLSKSRGQAADVTFYKAVIAFENKNYKLVKELIESEHFTDTLVIKRYAKQLLKITNVKLIEIELSKNKSW